VDWKTKIKIQEDSFSLLEVMPILINKSAKIILVK
jgi:hypothetical protein